MPKWENFPLCQSDSLQNINQGQLASFAEHLQRAHGLSIIRAIKTLQSVYGHTETSGLIQPMLYSVTNIKTDCKWFPSYEFIPLLSLAFLALKKVSLKIFKFMDIPLVISRGKLFYFHLRHDVLSPKLLVRLWDMNIGSKVKRLYERLLVLV